MEQHTHIIILTEAESMLKRDREGAQELLKILESQEKTLIFDSFTNEDALALGNILADLTKDVPMPITIRIFLDDIIVYQYTMKGDEETRFGWTYRKYQLIKKTGHSSMHGKVRAMFLDELQDMYAQTDVYGFGCGGVPIKIKTDGIIGAATISGLPDPADHLYVIKGMEKMLGVKAPQIPDEIDETWIN